MQKVRMVAQGRVQGVGFRWGVYSLALEIGGITGRVWNKDDGTVEILAQAEESAQMAKFIQEIRKGPTPFSRVTYLDVTLSNFEQYTDFKIAN
ncbi:putative nucleoside phosphatase [Streptococcus sp. DD10]|uniref:acylphosphatase n=1 Tax=Streptococcus sp. DD10 TaxID=1777878 RepID=UPI0007952643|nr:acylphosphatase [Streptococcus sp. DD10]KXT74200.1 putative nucleoside phosphatase [Streptococcus sp. DD10]